MTTQNILDAIKTAVALRNQIQTAIAAGKHILPAVDAVPATATAAAIPAKPPTPTGQLVTAAGQAHMLALNLQNHLSLVETDAKALKAGADLIATPAPAPEKAAAAKS